MITTMEAPITRQFVKLLPEGVPHIGMRQIEAEYNLSGAKAHRLMKKSGMLPYTWFNRSFYPEAEVRKYFKSLLLPQVTTVATNGPEL